MKIAILTQPLRANYGGVLQNYALQQVLINLGHKPITLEDEYHHKVSIFKLVFELPKRIFTKYILKTRIFIFSEKKQNELLDKFYNIKILKPFVQKKIRHKYVKALNKVKYTKYDSFIVGSDQVWRPIYNRGYIDIMFLSFIPKTAKIKRIAYGASFGSSEWEYNDEQTSICFKLIQNFDAVSTREIDGVDLCRNYLNRADAVTVLDPTLLLGKEDYLKLCGDIPTENENILFAYILDKDNNTMVQLERIAKEKGLKLKLVSADSDCSLSVEEWLAMFRDAKMVITDSFHGTVFSIIFNKEFYTIANKSRGGSRFASLLSQLSLTDRMYVSISDITINKHIDWNIINSKISQLKDFSINFLKTNLS